MLWIKTEFVIKIKKKSKLKANFVMLFEQMENLFFEAFEIEGNEEEHGLVVEALNLLLKEKIIFLEPRK